MKRWLLFPLAGVGVAAAVAVPLVATSRQQSEPQSCEASRDGDIVTIDLATCEAPSTTSPPSSSLSPTSLPSTSANSSTTDVSSTTSTDPPTTTVEPTSTSFTTTTVAATTIPATTTTTVPGGGDALFEFTTPENFYDNFDTGLGGLDPRDVGQAGHQWPGDHNMQCQGPDTERTVHMNAPVEWFWWCAPAGAETGHVMTSLDSSGYNVLWFSPKQWFTDVRNVCWDQNATWLGGGKWTQVMFITEADYNQAGGNMGFSGPGFQSPGEPTTGIFPTQGSTGTRFRGGHFTFFQGFPSQFTDGEFGGTGNNFWADKAQRFTHCIRDNENGTVTLSQELTTSGVQTRTIPGHIPNGQIRVVWQDDMYDGIKHDGIENRKTWHWDNLLIDVGL